MVHGASQCWAWALSLCFFFSFDFEHHCLGFFLSSFFFSNFWILWIFLYAPGFVWALSVIENFLLCPPVLFGHFHRWRLFMPPSIVWALSIIKEFFFFFGHLPPSVGCDPSQGYFQKTLSGSKGGCKGFFLEFVKELSKMAFLHLKCMQLGSVSLAFMRVSRVISHYSCK